MKWLFQTWCNDCHQDRGSDALRVANADTKEMGDVCSWDFLWNKGVFLWGGYSRLSAYFGLLSDWSSKSLHFEERISNWHRISHSVTVMWQNWNSCTLLQSLVKNGVSPILNVLNVTTWLWRPRICIITFALCIQILIPMPVWTVIVTSRPIMHVRTIWIISIAQNSSDVRHVHMKPQWNHECLIICIHIHQKDLTVHLVMWNLLQNWLCNVTLCFIYQKMNSNVSIVESTMHWNWPLPSM